LRLKSGVIKVALRSLLIRTVSLFYYNECLICGKILYVGTPVCEECRKLLSEENVNRCEICGIEIESEGVCGQCIISRPPYKRHISSCEYNGLIRKLIIKYKFNEIESLKYLFTDIYIDLMEREIGFNFDRIIPVPGDSGRERSFDPTLEISKLLSKRTGIPILRNKLIKVKRTEPQTGLGYNKRIKNLNGAFKLTNAGNISGERLLIVDDVFTTGTTIKKCTEILRKETKDIYAITLARSKDIFKDR